MFEWPHYHSPQWQALPRWQGAFPNTFANATEAEQWLKLNGLRGNVSSPVICGAPAEIEHAEKERMRQVLKLIKCAD